MSRQRVVVTLFSLLIVLMPAALRAAEKHIVAPGGPYTTIEAALQDAQTGDTIEVHGGVYGAPLTIAKTVTLIGLDRPVIDGGGKGSLVIIDAPDVVFRGFTLRNTGHSLQTEDTAIVAQAPRVTIADNVMEAVLFGIYFANAPEGVASGNVVRGLLLSEGLRGDGIRVWYSNHVQLIGNDVTGGRDILIWYADNITIRQNNIHENRYGLHFMYNKSATVQDNRIINNGVGAYMMYSQNLVLTGNQVVNSRGISGYGLAFKDMDNATISDNTIVSNRVGMFLDNSPALYDVYNHINNNLFAYNDLGVTIMPSVARNIFQANTFLENAQQVSTQGRGDLTRNIWSQNGAGNYWSDYNGFDKDGDGIGDLPYRSEKLFESLTDSHPALRMFIYSPAAGALDFAAAAFPALRPGPKLVDDAPLMRYNLPASTTGSTPPSAAPLLVLSVALFGLGGVVAVFAARFVFPRAPKMSPGSRIY